MNKFCELHYLLYVVCYDCIFVTESSLTADTNDGVLDQQCRYTIMRNDRINNRGGGVCVLISRSRTAAQVTFADIYSSLEIIAFDLLDVTPALGIFIVRPISASIL